MSGKKPTYYIVKENPQGEKTLEKLPGAVIHDDMVSFPSIPEIKGNFVPQKDGFVRGEEVSGRLIGEILQRGEKSGFTILSRMGGEDAPVISAKTALDPSERKYLKRLQGKLHQMFWHPSMTSEEEEFIGFDQNNLARTEEVLALGDDPTKDVFFSKS